MRRVVISVVLLLCILGTCVAEFFVLRRDGTTVTGLAERAAEAYRQSDYAAATDAARQLTDFWDTAEKRLSFFVGHDDIRELELSVTRLAPLAETRGSDAFLSECQLIIMLMEHIQDNQEIRFSTIF